MWLLYIMSKTHTKLNKNESVGASKELWRRWRHKTRSQKFDIFTSFIHRRRREEEAMQLYQGCWYYYKNLQAVLDYQKNFKPLDTDIIVTSYDHIPSLARLGSRPSRSLYFRGQRMVFRTLRLPLIALMALYPSSRWNCISEAQHRTWPTSHHLLGCSPPTCRFILCESPSRTLLARSCTYAGT